MLTLDRDYESQVGLDAVEITLEGYERTRFCPQAIGHEKKAADMRSAKIKQLPIVLPGNKTKLFSGCKTLKKGRHTMQFSIPIPLDAPLPFVLSPVEKSFFDVGYLLRC